MSFCSVRSTVIVLLGGLVLLFPADGLRALGLGEARVDSYLGQPLDVTIRLLEADSVAVDALTVAPASPEDYERLGLPSEALGLGLDVSLDRSSIPPTVRVRSQRPAVDPIVQILVDARFASGRVLREYTLFLDPPTVESPPPVRRAAEEVTETEPERTPPPAEPVPPRDERSAPVTADPDPSVERPREADRTVSVNRGDTLWAIGYNWRPDTTMSMDQVMLAIFERNRHAFINENINRLRSDVELTMPDAAEIEGVNRAEAERRIREHMQAWQQAEPIRDVPVVADAGVPEAEPFEASPDPVEPEDDYRLDVVPPEEDEFADGPAVSEGEIRRVQGALSSIEDEIFAEQLESREFDERIAEIREALESRELAGLAFAEESLAELESRLREVRQERAEAEAAAVDDEDEVVAYFDELERELVGEPDETVPLPDEEPTIAEVDEVVDPAEEALPAEAETPADPVVEPAEPSPAGFLGLALWQWAIAGVLLLLLLAGAAMFVLKRRGAEPAGDSAVMVRGDAEDNARKAISRNPADLSAHLALLKLLADRDDEERFSDAIDEMYQHVDDEEDRHWQEALGLAVTHAPDHPMLTPNETPLEETEEDDDLGRRTDQMLSMLDSGDLDEEASDSQLDDGEPDLELPDLDEDLDAPELETDDVFVEKTADQDDELGEDVDLADLSNRLDDPNARSEPEKVFDDDDEDFEIGSFDDDEADQPDTATSAVADEKSADSELSLDFGTDTGEADEVVAEPEKEADPVQEFGDGFDLDPEPDTPDETPSGEGEAYTLDFDSDDELDELSVADDSEQDDVETAESGDSGLTLDIGDDPDTDLEAEIKEWSVDEGDDSTGGVESDDLDEPAAFEIDDMPDSESDDGGIDETLPAADDGDSSSYDSELSDEDADVKLDLARAYISVDLADSARTILEEVVSGGSPEKQDEARKLLEDL